MPAERTFFWRFRDEFKEIVDLSLLLLLFLDDHLSPVFLQQPAPLDPLSGATRWAHGNALTLSGQGERRRNACNRRRHHLTPLRLTRLFSFSELGPVSHALTGVFLPAVFFFFFWGILYPEQKWAKKCQRFPKSLWVSSTDADHLQPCVHAGTISACMRFRAKPSWTNPIKPFSLAGCGRDTVFTAASAGTVKTPTPYKALCGQFGLLFKLQSVYFISPNDKPIRTASINRLFIIYCSLTYAAVNTHQLFYGLGFCLIGWEIDTIFGRTFKLFRCKSPAFESKKKPSGWFLGMFDQLFFIL